VPTERLIITALPLGPRVLLIVYSFSIEVVVWFVLAPAVWTRAFVNGTGRAELRRRLGWTAQPSPLPPHSVLVHAVSVGEMNAAEPLVAALGAGGHRIVLTTGTSAGMVTARRLQAAHAAVEDCVYLPWDRHAVRDWLTAVAPAAVVVVETEIWPNLFTACRKLRIPLFIANGRIRPRDRWKYRMGRRFFRPVLESADWIGVQSTAERDAFVAIGAPPARVQVAGNLKFDAARLPGAGLPGFAPDANGRPLVVAGSTHNPEERWLLECARHLADEGRPIRMIVAPRDAGRAASVLRLARTHGCRSLMWSELLPDMTAPWDVLVLDQYGVLPSCYAAADVVVIGGTFVRVGGHNILEAAAAARPILVGPRIDEIASLVAPFESAGALMRLAGADPARALADGLRSLLDHPQRARAMGAAAQRVCGEGAGSADRHARVIVERLAMRPA
jgi:3-deoxy-D-manno-octulosonic-acid transferase